MKIGDKVRFLSEVGGGVVSGFQGKDIVLVEDADGFDIPMPIKEVVVVDEDNYDMSKVNTGTHKPLGGNKQPLQAGSTLKSVGSLLNEGTTTPATDGNGLAAKTILEEDYDPADRPVTFKAKPQERRGGELINLYLAFLPVEVKTLSTTAFECYLVNDSNYFLDLTLMSAEGANWSARFQSTLEPNTKLFVEEFDRSRLSELEHLCVQALAYKREKSFGLKPAYSVQLRLDTVKFYKLHVFQPNMFFNEPCLLLDVVRDDKAVRQVFVEAEEVTQTILEKKKPQRDEAQPARVATNKPDRRQDHSVSTPNAKPEVIEVDLHIESLLDDLSGLSNGDMLLVQMKEFRKVMDENLQRKGTKIVFIHGKGEGVLRKSILQELKYRYKGCTWQDASFREYGYGATMVKI